MYMFEKSINADEALELYFAKVKEDHRFIDEIDEKLVSIVEKIYGYVFYDGFLHNHAYYVKNKADDSSIDGKIDLNISQSSHSFILNDLKKSFKTFSIDDIPQRIENDDEIKESFDKFLNRINEKLLFDICERHHLKPSKNIHIDIAPIENFTKLEQNYYFEPIYEIHYRDKSRKKDYISIISAVTSTFYQFEFVQSNNYIEFLKFFKRPIVNIPSLYLNDYYIDSYKVYESMIDKLKYNKKEDIYKKIKDNIEYLEYSQYKDYLCTGIFYFKIKNYLSKLNIESQKIKRKIYLCFLTLNYNEEAGIYLYKCGLYGLLPNNDLKKLIKYLKISCSLGSLDAKRLLYLHYSSSLYYDEYNIKKYS